MQTDARTTRGVCAALFCLLTGNTPLALAEGNSPLLLNLYQTALSESATLEAAEENKRAEQENIPLARADLLPSLSLGAELGRERRWSEEQSLFAEAERRQRDRNNQLYRVDLRQPLIRVSAWHGLTVAELEAESARLSVRTARQAFTEQFLVTYLDALRAQNRLDAVRSQAELVSQQLNQARNMLEAGIVSRLDVIQAQAENQRVQAELIDARGRVSTRFRALRTLTGTVPSRLPGFPDSFRPDQHQALAPERIKASALRNNPELQQHRLQVRIHESLTDQIRASHYPTLDLTTTASHTRSDWQTDNDSLSYADSDSDSVSISLQLTVPLYEGGRPSASGRKARAQQSEARARLDNRLRTVTEELETAQQDLATMRRSLKAARQSLEAQQEALDATRRTYRSGIGDMRDILLAQQQVFDARARSDDLQVDYLATLVRLFRSAGRLDEPFVRRVSQWLEAT